MIELIRRFLIIPVILLGLSVVFVALSLILVITKNKDPILRNKLRIGGLILALQGAAIQGAWSSSETCYQVSPLFSVDEVSTTGIIDLNLKETNEIVATLHYGDYGEFSFPSPLTIWMGFRSD